MDNQHPRGWNQAGPDAFNAYLYAQNAAAIGINRQDLGLSVDAPAFVPKTIIPPMNDWPHHQGEQPVYPSQVFPGPGGNSTSRHFVNQQQIHLAQQQQQRPQHMYHQQQQRHHPQQIHHPQQPHHTQQHHHPQQHFPNQQPQQQQHFMMMNQQQQQPHQQGRHQDANFQQHGNQQRGNVQNRLNFNNRNDPAPQSDVPHKQTETEQVALDYLSEVILKSNENPGLFENYQKRLCEMFFELANNHFVMSNAIEIIFEHSINEQNFRYTGARLCLLMDNLDTSPESTFRTLLLMKMDYQHTEQVPFMQNDQRRVRGTTLFLAELFVQLKREDDIKSNMDVSRYVLNSILLLLTKPGPENVKCVCQTLKLSGFDLQKENPGDVEDAINQLKFISEEQNIQTKRLIQSVVDLYIDNWGRKGDESENNSLSAIPIEHLQANYNDSPVFYGPDGQIITEEESSFLNSNMPSSDESDELVDDDDEPEMDLEIQMAYKEFINIGKQQQNEQRRNEN
ncbi:unnamed protein product [Diamesa serratosioi]